MIHQIAKRVIELDWETLNDPARSRLSLTLLANLSVGIAGVSYTVFSAPKSSGPYRLLGGGTAADAAAAAFWNAAAMHARTQDDFHPVGNLHIGTVVLPALMAVADEVPVSGREFLSALAAGYMVAVGLSRRFSPITTPRGLRSTCLYAPFGAAAAVAKLRGASVDEVANALALAVSFTGGTTQTWIDGSDEWQLHAGLSSEGGYRAAEFARGGVVGGAHALDGPAGFYHAVSGERPSFAKLEADFDPCTAIEEIAIKRYPVSGICQSVVLASERIAVRLTDPDRIACVDVRMNEFEMNYPGTLSRGPFHSFSSKLMSAAFCAGSTISHGHFHFRDFHNEINSEVSALIAKTNIKADAELPFLSAVIRVTLEDGNVLEERLLDSRMEVAIEWNGIDDWAASLWREAGRTEDEYESCRKLVSALADVPAVALPV